MHGIRLPLSILLFALALVAPPATAATPSSGTITPTQTTLTWSGGPFTSSTTDPVAATCGNSQCDEFLLTLSGTDGSIHTVTVQAEWANPANDFDLYVFDHATGSQLDVDGQAVGNIEQVSFTGAPGVYRVTMLVYRVVADSYTATATLGTSEPEPPNQFRTAAYQQFDFGFKPEVKLPEQERSLVFIDQDIEPEIEIDRFGTIYIGAIRGVPGGVDFWRSDDGCASFQYLGEPDGTQNPNPNPPSPEGGVGGGDVDISLGDPFVIVPEVPGVSPAIQSTGRIYCSSLWLGSATMSVSIDRGENWTPFPFTTAQLDRQWHVATGEKTLYMSLRKLAQIVLEQHDVYVTQSDDGGATFPKGTFVQDPLGDGVADDLAGNCVLTSDGSLIGSFVSRDGRDLYVYKAPRAGGTPPAEMPPGPLDVPVFVPNTFDTGLIFHGVGGLTANNVFPMMDVDEADNLHLVFSDRRNIYLMSCPAGDDPTNPGSWNKPVPLNAPRVAGFEFTRTALFPWVRAGAPGKLAVMWYGTEVDGDPDTPVFEEQGVPWRIIYGQVENALAETPDVYLDVASKQGGGVIHTGQICTRGLGCPDGTRELAEYSSLAIDNDGFVNIAYAGTIHDGVDPSGTAAITFFTKSTLRPIRTDPTMTDVACHDPSVSRKGGWHDIEDGRAADGTYCRNVGGGKGNSNAYLEFQYTGTAVDLRIARGPRGGNAEVFIDGGSRGVVDFWRPPTDPSNPDNSGRRDLTFGEFVTFATAPGTHTFRLEVRNTSTDPLRDMVYVDGFVVTDGAATGQGNPTEASTGAQGTSGLGGLASAVAHTLQVAAGAIGVTAVLEMADGANLDLLLLDPLGATIASAQTAKPTEVLRAVPGTAGAYQLLVVNKGMSASAYRLSMVVTREVQDGAAAAMLASTGGAHEHARLAADPFDAQATISYMAYTPGRVTVRVYNVAGQLVQVMEEYVTTPGLRAIRWDGSLRRGGRVSSGVYFYRVQLPDGSETRRKTAIMR